MLELIQISRSEFGEPHIHPLNLRLEPRCFNSLLGLTLSGKTTLMRLMAGLEQPSGGTILVDGEDVTGKSVHTRDVAMVYQQFINYPNMSVFDNIAAPLCASGRRPPDLTTRIGDVAELMRISDLLDRKPHELSGGQQQRTAIARALARHARLVLLDEPLANLDYKLREELREELPQLFTERNSVIVYSTADPMDALLMGGNTAALHEGRLIEFGPTPEIYHNPCSLLAARVFSDPPLNEADAEAHDGKIVATTIGVTLPPHDALAAVAAHAGPCRLAFRPHHLKLGAPPDNRAPSFTGDIILSEISGSESFIHVRVGACEWVAQTNDITVPSEGRVDLHVAPDDMMVFSKSGERLGH